MTREFRSDAKQYGWGTVSLHWLAAACVLIALFSGHNAADAAVGADKLLLLRMHVPFALLGAGLTLLRVIWTVLIDPAPKPLPAPRWQQLLALSVHKGLSLVVLLVAGSGMALLASAGGGAVLRGIGLETLATRPALAAHAALACLATALIVLHFAAALYHQWIVRDRIFARMGFGKL